VQQNLQCNNYIHCHIYTGPRYAVRNVSHW